MSNHTEDAGREKRFAFAGRYNAKQGAKGFYRLREQAAKTTPAQAEKLLASWRARYSDMARFWRSLDGGLE